MPPRHLASHTPSYCSLRGSGSIWVKVEGERLRITQVTEEALKLFGYKKRSEVIRLQTREIFEIVEYLTETNDFLLLKIKSPLGRPVWLNACVHECHHQQQQHWNLRDITHQKLLTSSPSQTHTYEGNALSISQFGVVEHVFPTAFMGLNISQLVDKPLMKFVHPEDLKILCNGLSAMLKSMDFNFIVRWQTEVDESGEMMYEPVEVHAILSERTPICLIKQLSLKPASERSNCVHKTGLCDDLDGYMNQWGLFANIYRNYLGCIHDYWYRHGLSVKSWNRLVETGSHHPKKSPSNNRTNCSREATGYLINLVAAWNSILAGTS